MWPGKGGTDWLIKRNLRQETPEGWLAFAKDNKTDAGSSTVTARPGKTIYRGATLRKPKAGRDSERVIYQVIERTSTAPGQLLFVPEIEVATYWTLLSDTAEEILPWYPDHGMMEQYHAEYKTDLNLERLPSGKCATNSLIMEGCSLNLW